MYPIYGLETRRWPNRNSLATLASLDAGERSAIEVLRRCFSPVAGVGILTQTFANDALHLTSRIGF